MLKQILRPVLLVLFGIILFAFLIGWFATLVGSYFSLPILNAMSLTSPLLTYLGFGNIIFLIGIPLVGLVFLGTRLLFKARVGKQWNIGLLAFWLLNAASLAMIALSISNHFAEGARETKQSDLSVADSLKVVIRESPYEASIYQIDDIYTSEGQIIVEDVGLHIVRAENNAYRIEAEMHSRGENYTEATDLLEQLNMPYELKDKTLYVDEYFAIPKDGKWRNQRIDLTLYVPDGKSLYVEPGTRGVLKSIDMDKTQRDDHTISGTWWTMNEKGLYNPNTTKEQSRDTTQTENAAESADNSSNETADTSRQE